MYHLPFIDVSSKLLMTLSIRCQNETLFINKVIKDIIRYDEVIVEKSSFLINVTSAFSRRQLCEYTETVKKSLEDSDSKWRQTVTHPFT